MIPLDAIPAGGIAGASGKGARASLYGKRIIPQINTANQAIARKWMGEKNWQALEKYAQAFPTK